MSESDSAKAAFDAIDSLASMVEKLKAEHRRHPTAETATMLNLVDHGLNRLLALNSELYRRSLN